MVIVLERGEIYSLSAKLAYSNLLRIINGPLSKPPAILAGVKPFFRYPVLSDSCQSNRPLLLKNPAQSG